MAAYKCPSCGKPFNGKRCRSCLYETFTEEIGHGLHTHRGEPLVIDSPVRRPIRRKNPFVWDSRTRTRRGKGTWVGVVLVLVIALAGPVLDGLLEAAESIGSAVSVAVPEPEPWPDQVLEQSQVTLPTDGTVLLDQDGIRVVADWQDGDVFDGQIRVVLENNSDKNVWLDMDELVVNGVAMQLGGLYAEAEAGQMGEGYLYLDETEVLTADITQFQEILFRLDMVDDDTYDTLASCTAVLHPDCDPAYIQAVPDEGKVLVNQDGVRVVYQGCVRDFSTPEDPSYGSLQLYLENETDYTLTYYLCDGTINGQEADVFLYAELPAHTCAIAQVSLYETYSLKIERWEDLHTVTATLEIQDYFHEVFSIPDQAVSFDIDEV